MCGYVSNDGGDAAESSRPVTIVGQDVLEAFLDVSATEYVECFGKICWIESWDAWQAWEVFQCTSAFGRGIRVVWCGCRCSEIGAVVANKLPLPTSEDECVHAPSVSDKQ